MRDRQDNPLRSYRWFLWLLSPVLFIYTLYRGLRDGGWRYFRQRFGIVAARIDRPVWFHCASVGEVNTIAPLINRLILHKPDLPIVISTTTPTGAQVARTQFAGKIDHIYLPMDWQMTVMRFLSATAPRCALFVETELWPNLYSSCAQLGIPRVIVNGRLTDKTLKASKGILRAYAHILGNITAILARSNADQQRFIELGAPVNRISMIGNLKFAVPTSSNTPAKDLIGRPYWLAASTHHDEELQIARVWRQLHNQDYLLVIAPRHSERRNRILRQLARLGANVSLRSRNDPINEHTHIYLADTMGELHDLITYAVLVVVGGSFIPRGGHNVLEPAHLGKSIITGPHMENFHEEAQKLIEARALVMVNSNAQLGEALARLLGNPSLREEIGRRAKACVADYTDITENYLDALINSGVIAD